MSTIDFRPKSGLTTVCTRPATARIFNLGLLAKSFLGVAYFAHSQAGETEALGVCLGLTKRPGLSVERLKFTEKSTCHERLRSGKRGDGSKEKRP
jgi:hypothetical protein